MIEKKKDLNWTQILKISAAFAVVSIVILLSGMISRKLAEPEPTEPPAPTEPPYYAFMDTYDSKIADDIAGAYDAANAVKKVFWIEEDAEIAPKPDPNCYGTSQSASELQWLLDEAADLLDGQQTVFSTDIEIYPGSTITYYLDESIFVVTWQELVDRYCYTYSEVKVAHPSQFFRYYGDRGYNSLYFHPASRFGNMSNSVMVSSADFYQARNHGIIVYDGEVRRTFNSENIDTCFIDENGDMILVHAGEMTEMEESQKFVDENNICFSLAFGPIIIEDGVRCDPDFYFLGETRDNYPRAALCQKDDLHYVVVMANGKEFNQSSITVRSFAKQIETLKCQKAYVLDGGRTGTIAMNGKALNPVPYERWISDVICFASAIPSSEEVPEPTEP